jgi:hypothetical protein
VDAAFAFHLRPEGDGFAARVPALGTARDIRDVAREVLVDGHAERFDERVDRWSGPEDPGPEGDQPYVAPQLRFAERRWRALSLADLEEVLAGTVRVMRGSGGRTDYVLRARGLDRAGRPPRLAPDAEPGPRDADPPRAVIESLARVTVRIHR